MDNFWHGKEKTIFSLVNIDNNLADKEWTAFGNVKKRQILVWSIRIANCMADKEKIDH